VNRKIWAKLTTILTLLSIVYALQCLLIPCKLLIWAWAVLACSTCAYKLMSLAMLATSIVDGWPLWNFQRGLISTPMCPRQSSVPKCVVDGHTISHKLFWDQTRSSSYQSSIIQTVISSFRIGVYQSQLHKSSQISL
jgi:hypothetical protein